MSGLGLSPRWGSGVAAPDLATMMADAGAFFIGDPDTLGLSDGSPVLTMEDAKTGSLQLTAGAHPFVANTGNATLLNGHSSIATTGLAHTLSNTAYSALSNAGAAPTSWDATGWTMLAAVDCRQAAPNFGGGPYMGREGTAKVALGTGGGAFAGAPSAEVFFVATTNGAAVNRFNWFTQAQPSGCQIVSLSYDSQRLRQMLMGAVDLADGVADGTINSGTPIAQPGFGLSDGYAGNASGINWWYYLAFFPFRVPTVVLRNLQRALALHLKLPQFYGLAA